MQNIKQFHFVLLNCQIVIDSPIFMIISFGIL